MSIDAEQWHSQDSKIWGDIDIFEYSVITVKTTKQKDVVLAHRFCSDHPIYPQKFLSGFAQIPQLIQFRIGTPVAKSVCTYIEIPSSNVVCNLI